MYYYTALLNTSSHYNTLWSVCQNGAFTGNQYEFVISFIFGSWQLSLLSAVCSHSAIPLTRLTSTQIM